MLVVYIVFPIYLNQIVNNRSLGIHYSEKMRPIKCFIWLLWLLVINAELTLESVNRKVNDLEVEMTALKVFNIKGYHKVFMIKWISIRLKMFIIWEQALVHDFIRI